MNTVLPLIFGLLSVVFAGFLLVRFSARKGAHLLVWTFGMLLYAVGGLCEAYNGAFGWNALAFRLWYLCGAFLSAAWLGQGSLFLLARRSWWVAVLAGILALGSAYAAVRIFGAAWSAVMFARKRVLLHRMVGNILIAVGAFMPAIGGSLSRLGSESLLYVSELLGALLMFAGFLFSTRAGDGTVGESFAR